MMQHLTGVHAFCSYNSGRTASAFLDFIKGEIKADSSFARVEELDALAKKYIGSGQDSAQTASHTCQCS